jgi:hypothetical protein
LANRSGEMEKSQSCKRWLITQIGSAVSSHHHIARPNHKIF